MLTIDPAKWNQTPDDLRIASIQNPHPRSRERYSALDALTQQEPGATEIARRVNRHPQTVIRWVHRYNEQGSKGLAFEQTGGPAPLFARRSSRPLMG